MLTWTVLLALCIGEGRAEEVGVPIALQIDLLGRVLWYERSLQRSADDSIAAAILIRENDLASSRAAAQLEAQLTRAKTLGGKTVTLERVIYRSPEQTRASVIRRGTYLVYLTPGLQDVVPALAASLEGVSVLTVSALGGDVARGAVLAFELSSSKPRIAVNLRRARAQKLDFSAQLLRLARVVP